MTVTPPPTFPASRVVTAIVAVELPGAKLGRRGKVPNPAVGLFRTLRILPISDLSRFLRLQMAVTLRSNRFSA
jgi:hypothetical protein